jgi:hypothetical protein
VSVSLANSQGSLWRFSETRAAWAGALAVTVSERLLLSVGAGRYTTTFSSYQYQW